MVEYIFKNKALLSSMEDSISDLIGSFKDAAVLHKIADNFIFRRENVKAEGVF